MISIITIPESDREKLALLQEIVRNHEHGRTSCSDSNPCNGHTTNGRGGYPRCDKCLAMDAINGKIPLDQVSLKVTREIKISRPSEDT